MLLGYDCTISTKEIINRNADACLYVPVLPINKSTLCYGSNDGGCNVFNKEPELSKKIRRACKWLNLKQHLVGKDVTLYGPGMLC